MNYTKSRMSGEEIMSLNLGDAINFVLDKDEKYEADTYEDLLDNLTWCFWEMLPSYLEKMGAL